MPGAALNCRSARRQVPGRDVYNDSGDKIGVADDLIVSPEISVSYIIVNVGGFIGGPKHDLPFR